MPFIKKIYNHYIIDMSGNNNFVQIPVMQGDGNNVRGFEVELISNGTQYTIDKDNTIVSIIGTKPDTCQILNECEVSDEGYILVDITSQMAAIKGRGDYSIVLMDKTSNSQLKSFPFYILTTPAPFDVSEIISGDEFQLLTKTITSAETVTDEAQQEIKNMQDLESEVSANEEIRINNENHRENAELNRKTDSAVAITNANTATTNANNAKQNAENAANAANTATQNANATIQQANTIIEEMKSLIKDDNVIHTSEKGVANGIATLDENGNIPASQLPSFVDDAVEGIAVNTSIDDATGTKSAEGFILTGETENCIPETGKIYVDIDENVTYRWTGSVYVSIGSSLTLGTNSSTAFPGDRGLRLEGRVTNIEEYHNNIPALDVKFDNSNTPLLGANVQTAIENLTQTATQSSSGLLSAEDKKRIDNYADLQVIEAALLTSNWSGNTAPFSQIVTVSDLLTYNNCSVELSPKATPIQNAAAVDACITNIQYDESVGLTFTAYGEKPDIDIPIVICVGTSMNIVEVPKYIETPGKAEAIPYDDTVSNISADNVQDAIDTLNSNLLPNKFYDAPATMSAIDFADTLPINSIGHYVFHGYAHNDLVDLPINGEAYGYIYRMSEAYSLIVIHYLYTAGLKTYTRIKVNEWQDWVLM